MNNDTTPPGSDRDETDGIENTDIESDEERDGDVDAAGAAGIPRRND